MAVMGRLGLGRVEVARLGVGIRCLSSGGGLIDSAFQGKGSGGRSSVSGIVATVFGSTGFIGRHIVHGLGQIGTQVICPWRGDGLNVRDLKVMGDLGQIVPMEFELRNQDSVYETMKHSTMIVNVIGKHHNTMKYTLEQSTVEATDIITGMAKELGIKHFVQISAANASADSESSLLRAKVEAEKIVRDRIPTATILRLTDVIGHGDRMLKRIMFLYNFLSYYPYVNGGQSRVQPVHILDVVKALKLVAKDYERFKGTNLKLAGPKERTMKEFVEFIGKITGAEFDYYPIEVPKKVLTALYKPLGLSIWRVNERPIVSPNDVFEELRNNVLGEPAADELTFADLNITPFDIDSAIGRDSLFPYMSRKMLLGKAVKERYASQ